MKKRVVVAMSGGVDSSVAAYLLKERGLDVVGVTMKIWEHSDGFGGCCGAGSIEMARKVAGKIEIPYYVLNFSEIFKERVIDNFCHEYLNGRTPNPCIRCNRFIKFEALIEKARELGSDYVATGHYAGIEKVVDDLAAGEGKKRRYFLKRGIDDEKDQSYVLYAMTQEQLGSSLMPLGVFTKKKVREIAREKGLPSSGSGESQEICFIEGENYGKFVKRACPGPVIPGAILDRSGKVIGEHNGIIFYTVGQRRGIGIPSKEPLYVISIDAVNNSITVGREGELYSDELIACDVNYMDAEPLNGPVRVDTKVRYRQKLSPATVYKLGEDRVRVKFDKPQRAITPGQAVVFYNGDRVLGGGTIEAF